MLPVGVEVISVRRVVAYPREGLFENVDVESRNMSFELQPVTPEGARLLGVIGALAPGLSRRAADADRLNAMCEANYRDIQSSGIAAAFVPESLGGFGLTSMHDWIVANAALARGDGSTGIAMSMHFSTTRGMAARYAAETDSGVRDRVGAQLAQVAAGKMLICATTTESGTDNLHPFAEATRDADGWVVSGRKYFVTMSPIATHVAMNVKAQGPDSEQIANVFMPLDTPGVHQHGDWDALGMRSSGSQSVSFKDCKVPTSAVRFIGPWGQWSVALLVNRTLANVPLVAAFLGIAESAYTLMLAGLAKNVARAKASGVQHMVAELQVKLATCQCLLAQMGCRLDDFMAGPAPSWEQAHELMKDYQSVKWVVNRHAIEIVDGAMDLAGGGGFAAGNPLTRLYRDVRAGPFMQPYSPVDAREYIGKVELGHWPVE